MIGDFLASWDLFRNAYLCGWLIAVLLALLGVVVVARRQIFIGAAVAQASTLGIAAGMWASAWLAAEPVDPLHAHETLSLMSIGSAMLAALVTAVRAGGDENRGAEAVTGWVFIASASVSILVLAHSPFGLEEIHHLLSSSIIGATGRDVWVFAALALASAAFVAAARDRLVLFMFDPEMAGAVGLPVRLWSVAYALWLGLVIGLAMRVTGLLYTFGCLVLPPLFAANVCRETRSVFAVAAAFALATAAAGFVLANRQDQPPAQMVVALQSGVLALAWCLVRLRRG